MAQWPAQRLPRLLLVLGMLVFGGWSNHVTIVAYRRLGSVTPARMGTDRSRVPARHALPPLGAVPATCPANAPPTPLPHGLGAAIGMGPVWVVGFTPGLSLHLGNPHLLWHDSHGWERKVGWVIGPRYHQRVGLRGWALGTRVPLWFQFGGQAPGTAPILDPRRPQAFFPGLPAGWVAFPSYLVIPRAGCYVLEASWPGGLWRLTFAAGQ